MRSMLFIVMMSALSGLASAHGCIKGAAVGGVVGHVAGHHAVAGAVIGCAVGHHQAKEKERAARETEQNALPQTPPPHSQLQR